MLMRQVFINSALGLRKTANVLSDALRGALRVLDLILAVRQPKPNPTRSAGNLEHFKAYLVMHSRSCLVT